MRRRRPPAGIATANGANNLRRTIIPFVLRIAARFAVNLSA